MLSLHLGQGVLGVIQHLSIDGDTFTLDTFDGCRQVFLGFVSQGLSKQTLNVFAIFEPDQILVALSYDLISNQILLGFINCLLEGSKVNFLSRNQVLQGAILFFSNSYHVAILISLSDDRGHSLLEFSAALLKLSEDFLFDFLADFLVLIATLGLGFSKFLSVFTIFGSLLNKEDFFFLTTLTGL